MRLDTSSESTYIDAVDSTLTLKEIAMKVAATAAQIQVRTSEDNRVWLKAKAQEQERSVNWLISKILDDARVTDSKKQNAVQ